MRTAENTKRYADTCREVGQEIGVPVVDLWQAFMRAAGWREGQPLVGSLKGERSEVLESLLIDGELSRCPHTLLDYLSVFLGLHFRPEGYRLMYLTVTKFVQENLPEHAPDEIPYVYPVWEQAPTPRGGLI